MKKIIVGLLLLGVLLVPLTAEAQQRKPGNPFKSKKFWIETAVTVTFAVLDARSTTRALKVCPSCHEEFPLFSARPSRKELYFKGGAFIAAERLLIAGMWKLHEPAGSALSSVATAVHVGLHIGGIRQNNKIYERAKQCPSGTTCNLQ